MLTALDVKYHGVYLANSLPYNHAIFLLLLLTPLVIYYFLWVHVINPKQIQRQKYKQIGKEKHKRIRKQMQRQTRRYKSRIK